MTRQTLVVSIHDVSPRTFPDSVEMLDCLRRLGVKRTSLLVVPDHHRRGHFLEDAQFCQWLREQAAAGHEIVAHGYCHERARRPAERTCDKWVTRVYTSGEGEFYDIEEQEAARLLGRARADFAQAGLHPEGFIAPAWLLSAAAERALCAQGWLYTTRLGSVQHLPSGQRFASQSLVWSVRQAWRRAVSLGWNALLFRRLLANPLLRIGVHPPDLHHPAIWRQICALTARALANREATTYAAWVRGHMLARPGGLA